MILLLVIFALIFKRNLSKFLSKRNFRTEMLSGPLTVFRLRLLESNFFSYCTIQ